MNIYNFKFKKKFCYAMPLVRQKLNRWIDNFVHNKNP